VTTRQLLILFTILYSIDRIHIEIDRHLIKEELDEDIICIPFVKIRKQLADILTEGE